MGYRHSIEIGSGKYCLQRQPDDGHDRSKHRVTLGRSDFVGREVIGENFA